MVRPRGGEGSAFVFPHLMNGGQESRISYLAVIPSPAMLLCDKDVPPERRDGVKCMCVSVVIFLTGCWVPVPVGTAN